MISRPQIASAKNEQEEEKVDRQSEAQRKNIKAAQGDAEALRVTFC